MVICWLDAGHLKVDAVDDAKRSIPQEKKLRL